MSDPKALREEARRYRRLANSIHDEQVSERLEEIAKELERRAAELEDEKKA